MTERWRAEMPKRLDIFTEFGIWMREQAVDGEFCEACDVQALVTRNNTERDAAEDRERALMARVAELEELVCSQWNDFCESQLFAVSKRLEIMTEERDTLRASLAELTEWRPMETIPTGEDCVDENGEKYTLLSGESGDFFRLLDSNGMEYVACRCDDDLPASEWSIWTGEEFVPLILEEGVALVGWMPLEAKP